MNYTLEGIYYNGNIEFIKKPEFDEPMEVLVIFGESNKKIKKLGGLFKNYAVDYDKIEQDLKELSQNSSVNILDEFDNNA